jgi:hypothetical protein
MMGMRKNSQETYAFFLANQSATSDVLDEKVGFTPAEFTNSGFKV